MAKTAKQGQAKQTTRMLKAECLDCGYTVRLSRKWLAVAAPECPLGHGTMYAEDTIAAQEAHGLAEWQERDARSAEREARRGHGGLSYEERGTCEWCGAFLPGDNRSADCAKCGHRPDPAVGHRNIPNRRKRDSIPF